MTFAVARGEAFITQFSVTTYEYSGFNHRLLTIDSISQSLFPRHEKRIDLQFCKNILC